MYTPPFTITAKIVNLVAEISATLEHHKSKAEKRDMLRLRKINQMKTIHGSLAIEGNTLTEEQVTALIEGKTVIAPLKEVQEVRNAIKAYENFMHFDPFSCESLLQAHSIIAPGLVDNPGKFRRGDICVTGKDGIAHIAPPADRVPHLMNDLFAWLTSTEDHPLIKSSVFHYEFEFIHPFEDGNGRIGRLWQSRILAEWNNAFALLPIENMIWQNQTEYYKAIQLSTKHTDSAYFIEFMLSIILSSLNQNDNVNDNANANVKVTAKVTANQKKILEFMKANPFITQEELSKLVGITLANINRNVKRLQENGMIRRIGADKNGHWEVV